ncbi:MAG: hypothetical protein ABSG02_18600 [Terriglobales bacterium]
MSVETRWIARSGGGERSPGRNAAQVEHAVAHVTVFSQMGRSGRRAAAGNHLIKRAAITKLRIELATKFTRPAGPSVKATDDGMVDVFHEELLLGRRNRFARL